MRKRIRIGVFVLVLGFISYFGYQIFYRLQWRNKLEIATTTIPQFSFQTITHKTFNKQKIKDTLGKVIIMLFSPDCEHCQYMAQSIVKHKEEIFDIQFLMVTPFGDSNTVAQFDKNFGLSDLPNVQLLLDPNDKFNIIFGANLVPSFYIYKGNRLVESIMGETKIDNLIN